MNCLDAGKWNKTDGAAASETGKKRENPLSGRITCLSVQRGHSEAEEGGNYNSNRKVSACRTWLL